MRLRRKVNARADLRAGGKADKWQRSIVIGPTDGRAAAALPQRNTHHAACKYTQTAEAVLLGTLRPPLRPFPWPGHQCPGHAV
eukprot:353843-Chlamydomonas_euryale.AAC.8